MAEIHCPKCESKNVECCKSHQGGPHHTHTCKDCGHRQEFRA